MSFEVLHIWLRNQGCYLLSPLIFFLGGVCVFVRGNSGSFLLHFLLYPHCPRLLTSFLSPSLRERGGFYWFSSWPFCGISTALWKPTQKPWFATTVFLFCSQIQGFLSSASPSSFRFPLRLPAGQKAWGFSWHWPGKIHTTGTPERSLPVVFSQGLWRAGLPWRTVSCQVWPFLLCLRVDLTYASVNGRGKGSPSFPGASENLQTYFKTTAWPFLCSLFKLDQSVLEQSSSFCCAS